MNTKQTYSGWFAVFGESGKTIETIFTVVMSMATVGILIFVGVLIFKTSAQLASAEDAEGRKAAKQKLMWILIGGAVAMTATILPMILWTTIGKFSLVHEQVAGSGSGG